MAGIKWTNEEDNFLKENYEKMDKKELLDKLNSRTWDAIKIRAEKFKIKRYNNEGRFADLDILLKDTNETYYWLGFIMADGNVFDNRLKIRLSIKDEKQLLMFKDYIEYNGELYYGNNDGHDNVCISIKDTKYMKELCEKFDIKHNKTYNPCNIKNIKDDNLLLSLIVGFIDGDGSIKNLHKRKDFHLTIKCHKSWSDNLNYMLKSIMRIIDKNCNASVKLTKCKRYSYFHIGDSVLLKELKRKMLKLNIPYMKRKWDIINFDYIGKYEKTKNDRIKCLELFNKGYGIKELTEELKINEGVIYGYLRKFKKEKLI